MEFAQDLVKGSIVPIVLALLRERPMYGYEIVKLVNARSGGRLEWKEGTLYPTLHRLESDGLLRSQWAEGGSVAPAGERGSGDGNGNGGAGGADPPAEVLRDHGEGAVGAGPPVGGMAGVLDRGQPHSCLGGQL